jgi:hypothetical protein
LVALRVRRGGQELPAELRSCVVVIDDRLVERSPPSFGDVGGAFEISVNTFLDYPQLFQVLVHLSIIGERLLLDGEWLDFARFLSFFDHFLILWHDGPIRALIRECIRPLCHFVDLGAQESLVIIVDRYLVFLTLDFRMRKELKEILRLIFLLEGLFAISLCPSLLLLGVSFVTKLARSDFWKLAVTTLRGWRCCSLLLGCFASFRCTVAYFR